MRLLLFCAHHARLLLIAGLLAGICLPSLAFYIEPWLPEMVMLLIMLAALRIGHQNMLGSLRDLPGLIGAVLVLQLALPLFVVGLAALLGLRDNLYIAALVLMCTAPSISGSANLAIIMGHPPTHAMRLLVVGTALLPLTILPVFLTMPLLGGTSSMTMASLRLVLIIALAVGIAALIRRFFMREPAPETLKAIDGLSALLLAVIVVGLMSAVAPTLKHDPLLALGWFLWAILANLGLQILAYHLQGGAGGDPETTVATSIIAGNRNIALFLVALPAESIAPLLIFIGLYQIPMYLTPVIMHQIYRISQNDGQRRSP